MTPEEIRVKALEFATRYMENNKVPHRHTSAFDTMQLAKLFENWIKNGYSEERERKKNMKEAKP